MELSVFVQNTIEQIVEGVSNSQQFAKNKGAVINPYKPKLGGTREGNNSHMSQDVIFDVALTSTSTDGSTEGVGVFLGAINLGKKNKAETENIAITKVKFTVSIVLPLG